MKPGSIQLIPVDKLRGSEFTIHGLSFSQFKNYYLFSPGLSNNQDTYFTAKLDFKNSGLLSHPELHFLIQDVRMLHQHSNKGNKLRIPTSVLEKLNNATEKKKKRDRRILKEALESPSGEVNYECWKQPVYSKVVSQFASPRRLPSGYRYYHSGLDLRAYTGTAIRAPASGKVIMTEHMVAPGKNIIIDHGGDIRSRYMHLSKFNVKVGDEVKKGQVIGLAGATGRVEAAHLHWEVLWKENRVSPLHFLQSWEQICDPA